MTIEKTLSLCLLHKITMEQFMLIYLVGTEEFQKAKEYYAYTRISLKNLQDLAEKDIILSNFDFSDKELEVTLERIVVNPTFLDTFFVNKENAAEEFLDHFYELVYVNNQFYPAINMDNDDFAKAYSKYIKGDIDKHNLVIKALDYYNSKLNTRNKMKIGSFALKKFVEGRYFDILISDYENKGLTNDTQTTF